mmetsp:Transcript_20766/g.46355  ORF Transcript_20766/g.46355 Transcript_20766/m.46355 type:complete len:238 (-) Transcript_20766:596-1309(-)
MAMRQQLLARAECRGRQLRYVVPVLDDYSILTKNADLVLYYISGWLAHAVSIVDERSKKKTLHYASDGLYQLVRSLECVYRKHGNEQGFARHGGDLFIMIEKVVLESDRLYEEKFLPCMDGIDCNEYVPKQIFATVVNKYTRMRGKYLVKSEKARQKKVGNQIFTTRQMVEVKHLTAKARAQASRATTSDADCAASIVTSDGSVFSDDFYISPCPVVHPSDSIVTRVAALSKYEPGG